MLAKVLKKLERMEKGGVATADVPPGLPFALPVGTIDALLRLRSYSGITSHSRSNW